MFDPCIQAVARVTRFMSNRGWSGFLASHPGWHAPAVIGGCVRAGAMLPLLMLPGAVPAPWHAAPTYAITEPAEGGAVTPRLPGSAPTAGLSQEVGASGIGAAEVAALDTQRVAIAAGGYPAPDLAIGPEIPGCCAMMLGLPNVPLLSVAFPPSSEAAPPAEPIAVPEPASFAVLGAGLLALGLMLAWRK